MLVPGMDDRGVKTALAVLTITGDSTAVERDQLVELLVEYQAGRAPLTHLATVANILLAMVEQRAAHLLNEPEQLRNCADWAEKGQPVPPEMVGLSAARLRADLGAWFALQESTPS